MNFEDPQYKVESVLDLCDRAKRALSKYTFAEDMNVMILSHGAMLAAVKSALSNGKISYEDRSVPIIQGNVLCVEITPGQEPKLNNLF